MHDLKKIAENKEAFIEALKKRNKDYSKEIDKISELDKRRREIIQSSEELKRERNEQSKLVGKYKKEGKDATHIMERVKKIGDEIKELDDTLRKVKEELDAIVLSIPNLPHHSVPEGKGEEDNVEISRWGTPREFSFKPKDHVDLATPKGYLDIEKGGELAQTRFNVMRADLSKLTRALINFMLDTNGEAGYIEHWVPFMVNRKTMTGTGQLPKFEEDLYKIEGEDLFLIPTAEVPLTNLFSKTVLKEDELPKKVTAYTPCFRKEKFSYGKDVRGIIRQHQFNKVEIVRIAHPDRSYEELEELTSNAAHILELLELPYRKMLLSSGDLGFSASKTYDLEVWLPGQNRYREISSCSNFEDFQARRANIKFKDASGKKHYVHTLNGSSLAVGRTIIAILENYQNEDGTVTVPEVLRKYMGCDKILL